MLSSVVESLKNPGVYLHDVDRVEMLETHCSVVFIAGEFVYKIKKPVNFGFLDYSTLEKRKKYCHLEIQLNRRLAPDVYLQVVAIYEDKGEINFSRGEVIDYAVQMRYLPEEWMMDYMLKHHTLTVEHMQKLGAWLAKFYQSAARGDEIAPFGEWGVVAGNCRENFTQMREFITHTITPQLYEALLYKTEQSLEKNKRIINKRAQENITCDTHGDLRLDHIYVEPQTQRLLIIDCIEFNDRFRYGDPVSDLAFLLIGLHLERENDLAKALVQSYFRNVCDTTGQLVLSLYCSYRATVRGKVSSMKWAEPETEDKAAAKKHAQECFLLAYRELASRDENVAIVLVAGLPGTGKSKISQYLQNEHNFTHISSDKVRKGMARDQNAESGGNGFMQGIYTPQWTEKTYSKCFELAEESILKGQRVVIDANFKLQKQRKLFYDLAEKWHIPLVICHCTSEEENIRKRLEERRDISDADWEVYQKAKKQWQNFSEEENKLVHRVHNENFTETTQRIKEILHANFLCERQWKNSNETAEDDVCIVF
ncbi:AAA family ATPase [Candidatus Uabimicrobium amorphum]|uniref:Aminoglycoside phosphotransferase n=1 Tax=Uabimicrobium amorphum TaxID=2596890 RepID=A0A5S9IPL4_UABAM|nr:AAA family ATPase [Candidatus Uabimicrobium amorphum]BBM85729.1 aminoglycoside phosphotransferase [Candidatus Uabimicrobium amorphum]